MESKAVGALLGTFVGDALGKPVEGYTPEMIASQHGEITGLLPDEGGVATYTDDTQMMIGVAESLVACRGFDGEDMARRFVANFQIDRGYGPGTIEVIYRLSQGVSWQTAGDRLFGGGSFGNGAAMRSAPVGVLFAADPARLVDVADRSARITHTHPLGRGGATLQALAVGLAVASDPDLPLDVAHFLGRLAPAILPAWEAYRHLLGHVRELLDSPPSADQVLRRLGNDTTAMRSVPTALYCFLAHPDSFTDCVLTAVNLGGDTDTIAAMAGALAGARLGAQAIPTEWQASLENGESGRDHVIRLGQQLHQITRSLG
jgi:poly(ADP-ribose) glycohydrolase ARH3